MVLILQQRGLFREEYESDTLRGNLDVFVPVNQYTLESTGQTVKQYCFSNIM
ncbi:hypothetical protein [Paenibacillus sp. FSL R10-2734]|uniref:hypothetical protein n=1 Tax=Paenibacillus sp. FSL R10-2734 TaxID=2954691 RepID=UPI0030D74198